MYTKIQICKCTDAKMCWGSMEQMWDFGTRLRILIPCDWWSDKHKLLISIFEYEHGYLNINPTRNEYLMLASFIIMRKRHSQSLHIKLISLIRKENTNTNTNADHKYKYKDRAQIQIQIQIWMSIVFFSGSNLADPGSIRGKNTWCLSVPMHLRKQPSTDEQEKRKKKKERKIFAKSRFSDEP